MTWDIDSTPKRSCFGDYKNDLEKCDRCQDYESCKEFAEVPSTSNDSAKPEWKPTGQIRIEIQMFTHALEAQMRYNEKRGKGDEWKHADPKFLFKRLTDEVEELRIEISERRRDQVKIRHESKDVGCLSFFIWYNSMLKDAKFVVDHSDIGGSNR